MPFLPVFIYFSKLWQYGIIDNEPFVVIKYIYYFSIVNNFML